MLKENWRLIARIEKIADLLICLLSFYLAYLLRDILIIDPNLQLADFSYYLPILIVAALSNALSLFLLRAYGSMRMSSILNLLKKFILNSAIVFICVATGAFLLKLELSRSLIVIFAVLLCLLLALERVIMLKLLRYWRKKGYNYRNIIICGLNQQCLRIASEVRDRPELGIRIRQFAELNEKQDVIDNFRAMLADYPALQNIRISKGIESLKTSLKSYAVDEIIFTDLANAYQKSEELMAICAEQGIRSTVAVDLYSLGLIKSGISYFGNIPMIHYQTLPGDRLDLEVKRLIDLSVSGAMLIVLSPLMIFIALAVKFTSKGPVIFKQKRMGRNGHLFIMYKFRSMIFDAEKQLAELVQANEMHGPAFKMKEDPRITKIGKFLRKHSLDELPQLWNVFLGDMSLVGPRPPLPSEVSTYEKRKFRRRLSMRPGLTCTWQVCGRNQIAKFEDWVKLDLHYIDNWSLYNDFLILLKTIPAVIFGKGQ